MDELQQQNINENKERFLGLFRAKIHRDGAEKLLNWLQNESDFFIAPASTRYHGNYPGGLLEHSLNVYDCLVDYLARPRVRERYGLAYNEETIAIVALCHDLCKVNFYKPGKRNVKDPETGKWKEIENYTIEDTFPYGHGEKSVYMVQAFMQLKREEALAIRWHMASWNDGEKRTAGDVFEKHELALLLHMADELATFIDER